eukprot:1143214-Pelagomonas_calceolata.AAC.2
MHQVRSAYRTGRGAVMACVSEGYNVLGSEQISSSMRWIPSGFMCPEEGVKSTFQGNEKRATP